MNARRRSIFRRPVLSRLALAWLSAFAAVGAVGGVFAYFEISGRGAERISLPVGDIEFMARAAEPRPSGEERLDLPEKGLRLAAPDLRNDAAGAGETLDGAEAEDILLYPDEFWPETDADPAYRENGIVITIPGAPATAPKAASLTPPRARPITEPDPALMRSTPFGKAPRIGPDGRKAMHVYAHDYDNPHGRPEIALVVGGLGLNRALTEQAIDELPPEVSLAFAPYGKDLDFWTRKAREAGHEVLIELPMEGYGESEEALGAAALLTSRSAAQNQQRLDWLMTRFPGYFAATNYMGAKFSADEASLVPVLAKLRESGVAYIDDTGAARLSAGRTGAAVAVVNRVIPAAPDDASRSAVRRELRALEQIAERNGAALGKTYAYAVTLEEIAAWLDDFEEKGLAPAPASSVLQKRAATR